ncbi:NlpC/P60 family protein, partial [Latilactobacillus sakei]|uniref:NlpC/P60 family protein n=6 Tax=Latilactobacillus TaxID=2767885 RepID=UPI003B9ABD67
VVHIVAKYKVSNGEWYYNFKFGDRYYWTNTRAFTDVASIVSKESVHMSAKITANNYGGFNTPSPLYGAKYLLSGKTVVNKTVSVVARYKVSNGEYYYNFKYGNRYYWMNTRAFSYYQNPSQYLQISDTQIKPAGPTPYNISYDYEGVKVWLTQRKLGLSADGHYGPATVSAVKRFQRNHGLKADGILNLTTWNKLGYSTGAWNQIDSYISPLKVHLTNSRSEHIEAMINTAYQYMNRPYIVGASSTPAYGVDCSGLTMQALYSAGINPLPSSSYIHAHPGHEWESRVLFANSKLKKVSYGQRQRGDLIFYRSPYDNKIWHVAIYLGNDQVIESWPPCVMVQPIKNSQRSWIAGVGRPFV